ncbi:MAG: glycerol-3-phosphate dehydrogenase/oxidase [Oscillatoriales cyanobacterium SM2_3_0]|nr:glycerol-3-phosphate dehydrogenase/oxidase [Oscillatoriales cyanobacterium SM2_3_0]
MERNLVSLTRQAYDVLVIGGGIYGAFVAWEASLRGLSVALVEKGDFGSATSANSLKTIHGGFRYLQNADFKRMRESIHERRTLMQIAPHLIHPLPVIVPTYGHGMKGKAALAVALALNDAISFDRNRLADPQKHIPQGHVVSRERCQQLLPGVRSEGLTGGAIFYDAQVYNSERLILALLRSASQAGARLANYVRVTDLLYQGSRIIGVRAEDQSDGQQFDLRARTVINTSGPWLAQVTGLLKQSTFPGPPLLSQAMNLVTTRPLFENYAVGLPSSGAAGSRFLFVAPWRGRSIIGTWYGVHPGNPDQFALSEAQIQEFLAQINQSYPGAHLTRDQVAWVHGGLLPCDGVEHQTEEPKLTKHYQIYDHARDGHPGMMSVVGVKYTTARDVAQKLVDRVCRSWGQKAPASISAQTPVYGGQIADFNEFLQGAIATECLSPEVTQRLVYNYGSAYPQVLSYLNGAAKETESQTDSPPDSLAIIQAEVSYAVKEEMAQTLSDVIFRRTELGSAGYPGDRIVDVCARTLGQALGWDSARLEREIQTICQRYGVPVPRISLPT